MPAWLAALLSGIASALPSLAALFRRDPVPEPQAPTPPAWGDIDAKEDAAAASRRAPGGASK